MYIIVWRYANPFTGTYNNLSLSSIDDLREEKGNPTYHEKKMYDRFLIRVLSFHLCVECLKRHNRQGQQLSYVNKKIPRF